LETGRQVRKKPLQRGVFLWLPLPTTARTYARPVLHQDPTHSLKNTAREERVPTIRKSGCRHADRSVSIRVPSGLPANRRLETGRQVRKKPLQRGVFLLEHHKPPSSISHLLTVDK